LPALQDEAAVLMLYRSWLLPKCDILVARSRPFGEERAARRDGAAPGARDADIPVG